MCDIRVGQLILCFPTVDPAGRAVVQQIRENQIEHVSYVESMETKLETLHLKPKSDLEFELHLVRVPAGQEMWKITYLHFHYKWAFLTLAPAVAADRHFQDAIRRSDCQFTAAPNYVMTTVTPAGGAGAVSVQGAQFGPNYATYRQLVNLPLAAAALQDTVHVLILDTGIAPDAKQANLPIDQETNFIDPANPQAEDDHGHGTALALLIADLAPKARFVIFKVADSNGEVSEWDALAGLVADLDVHVVNLSLQYGFLTYHCSTCGRQSGPSRSAVFENILEQLGRVAFNPVIVAAAGNSGASELAYPARFTNVLAAGAINSQKALSQKSNYGDVDHVGQPHQNHFVLPGGDSDPNNPETVVTLSNGSDWEGTSLAAAFGTAVVANQLSRLGVANYQPAAFLQSLRNSVDRALPKYTAVEYGHGILRA